MAHYRTIDRETLARRLDRQSPDNEDRHAGFALVNVLSHHDFLHERIPGSIHIPQGEEEDFAARFAPDKEIVVYCASRACEASARTARILASRGFERVVDFEEGLSAWRDGGYALSGASHRPSAANTAGSEGNAS